MTQEDRLSIAEMMAARYLDPFPYPDAVAIARTLLDLVTERQPPLPEETEME